METITSALLKKYTSTFRRPVSVLMKALAIFFLISSCDSNNPDSIHHSTILSDSTLYTTTEDSSFMDSLQIINHEYLSEEGDLRIRVNYPEIKGLKDTALQSQLNTRLNEIFLGSVISEDDDREESGEMKISYIVHYNKKGILSIAYSTFEDYSEASRSWINYFSLTVNLKNGKDILPEDLFINNYKEKISSLLQHQEDSLNKSGILFTALNKENLQTYCISKHGFVFFLNGSSDGEGTQEFKIPFNALKENIHPDFYKSIY
jgi:hypothetical protein